MIFWITDGILHKECDWLHMDEGIRFTVQDDSEEFIIPEGVTSFDTDLFDHMPHLRIISIPASVSSVTGFRGMPVPKILVSEENQHYQSREGMVLSKDGNVLHFVSTELEYAVVPDCVHEIASHAFAGCKNLKTVSLPDTLTKIGSSAFSRCSSLEKIVLPNSVEKFEFALFDSCSSLKEIVFPENPNIRHIEGMVCRNCSSLEEVKLPNTIEEIRSKAFEECSSLKSFIFPENLKSIESRAFHNCTSLQSVELPASLEKLETEKDMFGSTGCFEGCKSLRKVIVHGEIRIPAKTFAGCPGLKSMILKSKPSDKLFGDDDPHPVSVNDLSFLPAAWKPLAVAAFAEENGPLDDERAAAHLKYIKANASRLTKIAVEHPSLLRLMYDQLLIKPELIPAYLEATDGNEASVAALTEYRDHRPAKPKVNANTSVTRPKKESAAKGKYNLKLSEKKRTELLEAAVLANDTETVKELFEVYKKFESPGRSLGLACRFCGVQMVQVLLDLGVTFSYGCMQFIFPNCQVSDYSNPVIADDERKKITVLLCERDTELCAQMLYYAILYDDPIVYAALRAHGVIQISPYYTKIISGKTPRNQLMSFERNDLEYFQNVFIEAGAAKKQRMLSAMLESMPVDIIQFPASVYTDSGKNEFRKEFCAPGLFELCVEKTDLIKKVPKNKLLNALIDQGNASGLSYALAQKWIEGEKNLRALLKQAQKKTDVAPEVIAVLLDRLKAFGDDSFSSEEDLSMDINPLSTSALNKIWSTKSREDGTLIITSYKGEALDILIPETIGKKKVTALAEGVFDPEMARITEEQRKVRKAIVGKHSRDPCRSVPYGIFVPGIKQPCQKNHSA